MNDLDVAISAIENSMEIVRSHFGTILHRHDKGAGDFATNADIESENAILSLLHKERPEDTILGEESGRSGATNSIRIWLVDPLCGTLNYAARMRVAAINVALEVNGKLSVAAVGDPFNNEIFWTDGVSAYVRNNYKDIPLSPNEDSKLVDLNLDPPFPNASKFKAVFLASDPEFESNFKPRVVSTSIALTWVATGQRAAYVTDGNIYNSVHFAAGIAICHAAGCIVTDLLGNRLGKGAVGLIAAANSKTHNSLLNIVKKYME